MCQINFIKYKERRIYKYEVKKGDIAYIIENNSHVRELKVGGASGGFYTIKFCDSQSWAIRVREGRLYGTEDDANRLLGNQNYTEESIRQVPLH